MNDVLDRLEGIMKEIEEVNEKVGGTEHIYLCSAMLMVESAYVALCDKKE